MTPHGPLSIGLVSPGWPAASLPNGIVTYVSAMEGPLRAQGHRVSILSLSPLAPNAYPGVYDPNQVSQGRSVARRILDSVSYRFSPHRAVTAMGRRMVVASTRMMHAECALDILEMEESFGMAASVQGALPLPVCVRLHGPWFLTGAADGQTGDPFFKERVRNEGLAFARAAVVSAPARDVLDRVRSYYGLQLPDAEVIPNPVPPVPPAQRWTLAGCDRKRILFVGRFDCLKGADLIIDAFALILRRVPDARLCLVGPDGKVAARDGQMLGLQAWVNERLPGALESGQIEWLGVKVPSDIGPLRRSAMVTVVASRWETFPYSAAEAMAHGCPLVAAKVGGVLAMVRDRENGLLHEPGDAGDLAEKIVAVLENPELGAAMGERAVESCERELHPERVAARQVEFYRRTIERYRAGGSTPEVPAR